jgi:hypothetical protein
VSKLDTSNTASGKIAFALALKIISEDQKNFIVTLSQLRNFCVHDFYNFDFNLDSYLQSLVDSQKLQKRNDIVKYIKKGILTGTSTGRLKNDLLLATANTITQLNVHRWRCQIRDSWIRMKKDEDDRKFLDLEQTDELDPPDPN